MSACASLRFRRSWFLLVAIGLQILIFGFHGPRNETREIAYVASYLMGLAFLLANRRTPGFWMIGVGALLNLAGIVANGGVMPAAPSALDAAGLPHIPEHYTNSVVVPGAHLMFLGDIFAVPASWPLHNVFSIGDVCIALGVFSSIHLLTGSRLFPRNPGQFAPLFRNPSFVRVWSSQVISNLGDWMYSLAVAALLARRTGSAQALAILLIAYSAPAAVFGLLLSPLTDRYSRRALMVGADVTRGIAVLSLLLVQEPSTLHIYAVAASLGLFGCVFQPSLQASIPNLVPKSLLVPANSLISATFHFAVIAGPALGGLLVAQLGSEPVFLINALSFGASALLLIGIRLPLPERSGRSTGVLEGLKEGIRYTARNSLARAAITVTSLVLLAAATKAPLESLFVLGTLSLGPEALGLLGGSWGLGMLLGAATAPTLARRVPRERLLFVSIGAVGFAVLLASQARQITSVLLAWLVAGAANSIGNVSYSSLLQERIPDGMRGRVFAASEAGLDAAYLLGALLAGWVGSNLGIRQAYVLSGAIMLLAALLSRVLLPPPPVPANTRRDSLERILERPLTESDLAALGLT